MSAVSASTKAEHRLDPERELRCEASSEHNPLILKLVEGSAEIFGIEMAQNKEYKFMHENFAVFSWYGCKIESTGEGNLYVADSTPMVSYVNTHAQLEFRRDVALSNQDYGPRVLIVGDADCGVTTTARILAAYAARLDRTPIFVDLDVSQGSINVPGSIAAVQVDKSSINIEEGFGHAMPLSYNFGHPHPKDNLELYYRFVDALAAQVRSRLDADVECRSSGVVVSTFGWVDGASGDLIQHLVRAFNVDVLLVMNHDKLFSTLSAGGVAAQQGITVVKLPTSGGVVRRDQAARRRLRQQRIREYFYGKTYLPHLTFQPARINLKLSAITLLRAGGIQLSEGMRVLGDDLTSSATEIAPVSATSDLLRTFLAVLNPPEETEANNNASSSSSSSASDALVLPAGLSQANVAGYVAVLQLNVEGDSMTVLSPCPGALPSRYLLVSSIKWSE